MKLMICPHGEVCCLYDETLDLSEIGSLTIKRGSFVEPNPDESWSADLKPVDGPQLGPFPTRSAALTAERTWLERYWLTNTSQQ